MTSEKALYWMAVGLMALILGNHFVERFDGRALAARSMAVVERISAGSEHLLATALGGSRCDRSQAIVARAQARVASVQAMVAREDAACARVRAERSRLMVMQRMPQMNLRVVVPDQNFRVEIPQVRVPQVRIVSPDDRI